MERMTRLRAIRLKYGISLVELERHSHVSNQYLSALELEMSAARQTTKKFLAVR
mgnify:CR=1 FL=1